MKKKVMRIEPDWEALSWRLAKDLEDLHFCAARVRSATFRFIDQKQFDNAIIKSEKSLKCYERAIKPPQPSVKERE